MKALIIGCGFVGQVLARQLQAAGWDVTGVARHLPDHTGALPPFRLITGDLTDRASLAAIASTHGPFQAVINTASSGRGGPDAYRQIYVEGNRLALEIFQPQRFIFTGSTSVYAQTDGTLVDETSPTQPTSETGRLLLHAEQIALAHPGGSVVRLGALYAPGRWIYLSRFLSGEARIEDDGSRFINQIYRDDAASAIAALLSSPHPAGIYNATDGHPISQIALYRRMAQHFGQPLPPSGPRAPHRKRGWSHKQVSNAKLRAIGWTPAVPDFTALLPDKDASPGYQS